MRRLDDMLAYAEKARAFVGAMTLLADAIEAAKTE